jgi:hypothetical protein
MIDSVEDIVYDVVSSREKWEVEEMKDGDGDDVYAYLFHYKPKQTDIFNCLLKDKEPLEPNAFLVASLHGEDEPYGYLVEKDDKEAVEDALHQVLEFTEEIEEDILSFDMRFDKFVNFEYDWFDE